MDEKFWFSRTLIAFNITIDASVVSKVFILEDCPDRIKWFKDKLKFVTRLDITKQPGQAVEWLNKTKYDLIFLDHDLYEDENSYGMGEEPEELTGLYVAKKTSRYY